MEAPFCGLEGGKGGLPELRGGGHSAPRVSPGARLSGKEKVSVKVVHWEETMLGSAAGDEYS